MTSQLIRSAVLACCVLLVGGIAAQDLEITSDGEHLWLVLADTASDGQPVLQVYHCVASDPEGHMDALEPIPGELRPHGLAAAGDRLLLVLDDGQVLTRQANRSRIDGRWSYVTGNAPAVPEGCGLLAIALADDGPWVLVRAQTPQAVALLAPKNVTWQPTGQSRQWLNEILGLPLDLDLDEPALAPDNPADPESEDSGNSSDPVDPVSDGPADQTPQDGELQTGESQIDESQAQASAALPDPPIDYLAHAVNGRWVGVALPADYTPPTHARLLMRQPDDAKPVVLVRDRSGDPGHLVQWQADAQADAQGDWVRHSFSLARSQPWSAAIVDGQVVVGVERTRSASQIEVDLHLLRSGRSIELGSVNLPTADRARWGLVAMDRRAYVMTRPGPRDEASADHQPPLEALVGYKGIDLQGKPTDAGEVRRMFPAQQSTWEQNADWLIQIAVFTTGLCLLMVFWRRTAQGGELELPERVELAPLSLRLLSGLIDLLPGFWVASAVYTLTSSQIVLQYWPGSLVPKSPAAMMPGLLVILVTVGHTTLSEMIAKRSLGKWMIGLYVTDFKGKPASPGALLVRALMRVFDLLAPLMLILMVISPCRQRLGDLLAKTVVVLRLPEEVKPE